MALECYSLWTEVLVQATTLGRLAQLAWWLLVQMASMVQLVVHLILLHLLVILAASSRSAPLVVPTRADLETVKLMMEGDTYIGRGCKQRGLPRSVFGHPYKLCNHSRSQAVAKYRQLLDDSPELSGQLINLSGRRLLCHCKRFQQCHGDAIIAKFVELYPGAYDRDRTAERVPTSEELNLMAILREEPSSDEGSTADEFVPDKGSGWVGSCPPMRVGVGCTARDMCDGQGLPSPGRSPIASRRYPASPIWKAVTRKFEQFSTQYGTVESLAFRRTHSARRTSNILRKMSSTSWNEQVWN